MQSIGGQKRILEQPRLIRVWRGRVVATPLSYSRPPPLRLYFRSKLALTVKSIWIQFAVDNMHTRDTNGRLLIFPLTHDPTLSVHNRKFTNLEKLDNSFGWFNAKLRNHLTNDWGERLGRKLIISSCIYLKPTRVIVIPLWETVRPVTRKQSRVNVVIAYFTRSRVSKRRFIEVEGWLRCIRHGRRRIVSSRWKLAPRSQIYLLGWSRDTVYTRYTVTKVA